MHSFTFGGKIQNLSRSFHGYQVTDLWIWGCHVFKGYRVKDSLIYILLVISMAFVNAGISLCCRIYLHLWFDSVFSSPILADLKTEDCLCNDLWTHTDNKDWFEIFTCKYLWPNSSLPSLYHTIVGLGFPFATHRKTILCPSTYS